MDYNKRPYFYGTGRRKTSVARVRLYAGTGSVKINGRDIDDYFGLDTLKLIVRQPLHLTGTEEKFDIECRVSGGGVTGQAARSVTVSPVRFCSTIPKTCVRCSRRPVISRAIRV